LSSNYHHLEDSGTSNLTGLAIFLNHSVEMAPTRLPLEIWGRVFEHYFQPMRATSTGGMMQTTRAIELGKVCTAWKVGVIILICTMCSTKSSMQGITEPYVYRDLAFYVSDTVSGLERAAYALHLPARSDKVFRWTRTLLLFLMHAVDDRWEALALEAATAIVLHARQLLELSVFCCATPHSLLAVVAAVAPTSLRHLNLTWEASGLLALMISCIGSFYNLQTLTLTVRITKPVTLPSPMHLDEVTNWAFRKLEKIVVESETFLLEDGDNQTLNQLLRFLSRCLLGEPTRLCLSVGGLFSSEDGNAVETLLRSHIALSQCHLRGTPDIISNALSFVDARYLKLQLIPSTQAAASLGLRLRILCIQAMVTVLEVTQLEAFMIVLENHRPLDAEPLQIHVKCETQWTFHQSRIGWMGVPFRWRPTHPPAIVIEEQHSHMERMRLCAERLKPRGVYVLDYDGYTFDGSRFELLEAEI
jgi:hypothetical protein